MQRMNVWYQVFSAVIKMMIQTKYLNSDYGITNKTSRENVIRQRLSEAKFIIEAKWLIHTSLI